MGDPVHFWYEFGSTYSYLSVMRIEAVADAAGAELVWRPFLLGPIFAEQGWNDSPFNIYPNKGRYMWRDLERLCEEQGLGFKRPSVFPRNGLRAARIAYIAGGEGWCGEFTRAVFFANFAEDREISEAGVLAEILSDLGRDAAAVTEASTEFLNNEFSNWNFVANLPDIPGVLEAITEGTGMPGYTEAVATEFPDTNWAHYATMFDGGLGGQTGFYNIMLVGNPLLALDWWDASCVFGETALSQSEDTFGVVPSNYRYYFGTGSRHTMWGNDKVYDDTTGSVPTIVDWVNAMLASGPDGRDEDWTNVLCTNCGLLLEDDPSPEPLAPPFEQQGGDVVIVCE
jgi:2-hydroxychromene-2-carboxylate isomerase